MVWGASERRRITGVVAQCVSFWATRSRRDASWAVEVWRDPTRVVEGNWGEKARIECELARYSLGEGRRTSVDVVVRVKCELQIDSSNNSDKEQNEDAKRNSQREALQEGPPGYPGRHPRTKTTSVPLCKRSCSGLLHVEVKRLFAQLRIFIASSQEK